MSVSIILCPSCNSLLLPDTAQCPSCHHVLIEGGARPAELGSIPSPPSDSNEIEDACPGCNELVRRGLVRCWNCGTFMREEIAQTYQRMQATPPKVIYSELPEDDAHEPAETPPVAAQADDVDFELGPDIDPTFEMADDDFDTATPLAAREDDIVASAPTFKLKEPEAAEEPKAATEAPAKTEAKKEAKPAAKPAAAEQQEFVNEFESQFGAQHHSIATGGDVLLQVALAEEAETGVRRRNKGGSGSGRGGFVVYCPHGHRVEVQERHRGLTGRCPRCREPFVVPAISFDTEKADAEAQAKKAELLAAGAAPNASEESEISAGEYTRWLTDVHHHTVNLTKLKLKTGSLINEFVDVDLAFSPNGMLVITLVKKGGLFGSADKKKPTTRAAVIQHLSDGKDYAALPGAARQFYDLKALPQIRIVQPIASADESMFAGVPVFGDGRIAVRFPKVDETPDPQFASFTLSEFRKFSEILEEYYGIKKFGAELGVPLEDVFIERVCHSSQDHLSCLENLEYYQNDPTYKLKLIGRKCASCGIVMSEDVRVAEKFGGKNAKGIAKAKCPKCEKPFGDVPLYKFDDTPPPAPPEAADKKAEKK
ncbi:MAG: hypothetical protein AB7O26_17360 [Planctomycetaceae bacterium]